MRESAVQTLIDANDWTWIAPPSGTDAETRTAWVRQTEFDEFVPERRVHVDIHSKNFPTMFQMLEAGKQLFSILEIRKDNNT